METNFTCTICQQIIPLRPLAGTGGASGYAHNDKGEKICYTCADNLTREALKDRKPIALYVSGNNDAITTWTGGHMMRITSCHKMRHNMAGVMFAIQAIDTYGNPWHGRGRGHGMAIKMHPSKA